MDDTRTSLLVRLQDRADQEAWAVFDRLYRPMIVGYARTRGLSAADAEDVAQQCMEAVLRGIGEYRHAHPGSFRAWLRTIAERRILDLARRRREVQPDTQMLEREPASDLSPDEAWDAQWRASVIDYCLSVIRGEVTDKTHAAFLDYAIEGHPVEAVAQRLTMTVSQVYQAKHRVLTRLRQMVQDLTGETPERVVP